MNKCCQAVTPLSVAVVPGVSVTYTLPGALDTDVCSAYTVVTTGIKANHTGTEEVIFAIGTETLAAVDNCGMYVTSQMLPCCPWVRLRIQIVANGATGKAVAVRRGLAPRRTTIAAVTPPTP